MARKMSPAAKRYTVRLAVLMSLYLVLFFVATWLFRHDRPSGVIAVVLALAPAVPVIGVFWAVMRFIVEETDEFMRMLLVRQCLFASGFSLAVVTVWEFLQNFDLVAPGNGGFGAFFFWAMGLGLGALFNKVTMGTAGSC
ncbi:hypothetical protein [Novosphingobium sp.]|uniref:hypothetical protein n=1 Tax=Novosphingobium sp. TaxID=1874826 RepID=UPI00286DA021|nr:hypothetical protein [Novosphingobium sp.]